LRPPRGIARRNLSCNEQPSSEYCSTGGILPPRSSTWNLAPTGLPRRPRLGRSGRQWGGLYWSLDLGHQGQVISYPDPSIVQPHSHPVDLWGLITLRSHLVDRSGPAAPCSTRSRITRAPSRDLPIISRIFKAMLNTEALRVLVDARLYAVWMPGRVRGDPWRCLLLFHYTLTS